MSEKERRTRISTAARNIRHALADYEPAHWDSGIDAFANRIIRREIEAVLVADCDHWKREAQAAHNLADMQTEIIRAALAWHQAIEELNGVQAAEDALRALIREIEQ